MEEKHTPSEIQEALDVLRGGRETLLNSEWRKSLPSSDSGEHCAVTALLDVEDMFAPPVDTGLDALVEAALALFPERIGWNGWGPVGNVNDHPDTTFEDVLEVYDLAECFVRGEL